MEAISFKRNPIRNANILIIEDDDIDVKVLERAFKKEAVSYSIFRAKDGLMALEMLRGEKGYKKIPHPFILLVDLNMPRMGGIEFVEALRNDKQLNRSIVFVVTTSKSDEDKVAAYNLNVAGYIVKDDIGQNSSKLIKMLGYYWDIVEFP